MKLPLIKDLRPLIKNVKSYIADDIPGMQLTIGWDQDSGEWSYQTGDNSFTGGAYHYPTWGVVGVYRLCGGTPITTMNQPTPPRCLARIVRLLVASTAHTGSGNAEKTGHTNLSSKDAPRGDDVCILWEKRINARMPNAAVIPWRLQEA
jgi:hypothetical protein